MDVEPLRSKYKALASVLNERARRIWAATEAREAGRGGITLVARATGISYSTIVRGLQELRSQRLAPPNRVRRAGGGRKKTLQERSSSGERLGESGGACGLGGSAVTSALDIQEREDSLEGASGHGAHQLATNWWQSCYAQPATACKAIARVEKGPTILIGTASFATSTGEFVLSRPRNEPVISVDTKKKELVGDFKNAGKQWRPKKNPHVVRVHDFIIPENGKAIPYGVYDLTRNAGWVSVGIDHDTASFAVRTIDRWWRKMGRPAYPHARSVLITADAAGSNGSRIRLWKWELQQLATRTGLSITVCHFPPGTSKWNKIEHRLFSYIRSNWRGQPLTSLAVIVSLIASTRTVMASNSVAAFTFHQERFHRDFLGERPVPPAA